MEPKVPMRTCIACKSIKPKRELVRIVKSGNEIALDLTGRKNGRGAYICKNKECFLKLKKSKLLNKTFGCQVEDSVYDSLAEALSAIKE